MPVAESAVMKAVLALTFAAAATGCMIGDTTGSGPGPGSNSGSPDAGADPTPPDAPVAGATCAVERQLGTATVATPVAEQHNQSGSMGTRHYFRLYGDLPGGTAASADVLLLETWDGKGPFVGGAVKPGTYTISGADTSIATCGVCLYVMGDVDAAGVAKQVYLAQSGTVTIEAVGTTFTASVSGVGLAHWDMTAQAAATDSCTADLGAATMSAPVTIVSGGGGGGGGGGG